MRPVLLFCALSLLGGCAADRPDAPPPRFAHGGPPRGPDDPGAAEHLFISPMGEPFRGGDGVAPADAWFRGADRNGDGQITLTEMILDGARFFKALDVDGNGEIGPAEIDRYETVIAPEVQSGASFDGNRGDGDRPRRGGGRRGGMGGGGMGGMGGGMGGPPDAMGGGGGAPGGPPGGGSSGPAGGGEPLRGAARFGYLALPEPVIAADANMDRAISLQEFQAAAQRRFALLDANRDGVLTPGELPRLQGAGGPRGRRGKAPPADRMPIDPPQS